MKVKSGMALSDTEAKDGKIWNSGNQEESIRRLRRFTPGKGGRMRDEGGRKAALEGK